MELEAPESFEEREEKIEEGEEKMRRGGSVKVALQSGGSTPAPAEVGRIHPQDGSEPVSATVTLAWARHRLRESTIRA